MATFLDRIITANILGSNWYSVWLDRVFFFFFFGFWFHYDGGWQCSGFDCRGCPQCGGGVPISKKLQRERRLPRWGSCIPNENGGSGGDTGGRCRRRGAASRRQQVAVPAHWEQPLRGSQGIRCRCHPRHRLHPHAPWRHRGPHKPLSSQGIVKGLLTILAIYFCILIFRK